MASLTALQAPKAIGTKSDGTGSASNILIRAASSGIGTYAVQLAKLTLIRQQRAEDVKKREKEMVGTHPLLLLINNMFWLSSVTCSH
jgi:NADPH:quinone reductase-like Zn-dependent oxidoreductase